ncbi:MULTISPECIES: sulfurtransferase [Rhodanobacter]|uniref:sulfurtransferase n=1 Tax=Rhodanobacter TaxID=75309 RepID=UPI000417921A|nr:MULTISPECIES: sulfurtransferase [Rhodanobacter]KZC19199.1 sulfurtransferase [Rhodanobacter denitrificans]UJJ49866.1 sulfurtransferase [Rhodanobacter denitrificans]UJJ57942.1 sulfurtransferase [Rhodanobacter denitrificans]UJM92579.1 sulfurtransferase [Rhodanobacter denitrificans]UJM96109.1 sulfurtransferase [Rhodanobacter denitrificans]
MTLKTTLIDVAALAALPASDVLIVDCRVDLVDRAQGERSYLAGHVPGAVFADLERDLSDMSRVPAGLGRHPLPTAAAFSAVLGRWGWVPGLQVVCYDTGPGALAAARLWWLLRLAGVREVAVLDGGFAAWQAAGQPLETAAHRRTSTAVALAWDARQVIVDHAALHAAPAPLLLDARAAARYRGDVEPLDRAAGHVPGARNRPYLDNLCADGHFKPPAQLREEFAAVLGDTAPDRVVHMCGSGVTACYNLLAMEHAGLHGSRLYTPSWSGWVSDPSRPVATG